MAMSDPQESALAWLAKKYFDECSLQFRTVWDLYLKFYVVFLTVNATALGLTVQYVELRESRAVIAAAFVMQNIFAAVTAFMVSRFSAKVAVRAQDLAAFAVANVEQSPTMQLPLLLAESPIPGQLGKWGAMANLLGHAVFCALWLLVIILKFPKPPH
jgi:hypothetical protein